MTQTLIVNFITKGSSVVFDTSLSLTAKIGECENRKDTNDAFCHYANNI